LKPCSEVGVDVKRRERKGEALLRRLCRDTRYYFVQTKIETMNNQSNVRENKLKALDTRFPSPTSTVTVTSSTDSTTSTLTPTSPEGDYFAPLYDDQDWTLLKTPCGKIIDVNYSKLGVTPSKMREIGPVLNQIVRDGCNINIKEPSVTLALYVFLYGRGYFDGLSREERIRRVRRCVSPIDGRRKRLVQIVFSKYQDRVSSHGTALEVYLSSACTVRLLF
jgi:hypothetical protein